ncbi:hypothetical protein PRUPE_5G087700 [Prunus persica]|uniref:Uncharacterized protein n=1 Tax=Prunus persica TaxID=3760 RepID=A0A251P5S2_PRUPE|nr:hypothetical protein PRUPE_5G087700 [Prunus persica]
MSFFCLLVGGWMESKNWGKGPLSFYNFLAVVFWIQRLFFFYFLLLPISSMYGCVKDITKFHFTFGLTKLTSVTLFFPFSTSCCSESKTS